MDWYSLIDYLIIAIPSGIVISLLLKWKTVNISIKDIRKVDLTIDYILNEMYYKKLKKQPNGDIIYKHKFYDFLTFDF